MFKMTFNKPSVKMFFQGEDAAGIQFKQEGHRVFFRPVSEITDADADVMPISGKQRGGAEAIVEGNRSDHLLQLLTNPLGNPYYILKRTSGGWMEAVPHTGARYAPERWEAHIRVWPRETSAKPVEQSNLDADNSNPRTALPAQQLMRDTLQQIEARAAGVAECPPNEAFAAIHEMENLFDRFRTIYNDNPLPNQKVRKPRTHKPRATTKMVAGQARQHFRSVRERAFATA